MPETSRTWPPWPVIPATSSSKPISAISTDWGAFSRTGSRTPSIHFAAESHVDRSIFSPQPVFDTNLRGSFNLLETMRAHRVARFIHVSTDEVYGSLESPLEADESFPLQPSSPYSAAKAGSDLLALGYHKTYKLPVIVTRASNNYGPYQFPEKLIPLMISNALESKPLPVYGDGMQIRDWLYVEDHCRALLAVLEKGRDGEIYNIGGNCSLAEPRPWSTGFWRSPAGQLASLSTSRTVPATIAGTRFPAPN